MHKDSDLRSSAAAREIADVFLRVGARGHVHACPTGHARSEVGEVALDADTAVSAASVIKILFLVAFAQAVDAGTLDSAERVEVPDALRIGGSGTAGFADPPLISLRDLALSMMTVSDNAATDVIFARDGRARVEAVIADLGLAGTRVVNDMMTGARQVAAELGLADERDLDAAVAAADPDAVRGLA